MNTSAVSGILCTRCVFVPAPLMPEVALVELPPQNDDLSKTTVLPPHSTTWFAADIPASPPPTTITWLAGNTAAIASRNLKAQTPSCQRSCDQLLNAWCAPSFHTKK